jgi:RNA polymerase sigma factor (sigma-70 family)
MANVRLGAVLGQIQRLVLTNGKDGLADSQLLDQFAQFQDQGAFAALVKRYGPMVLRVCRRVLGHHEDAEDAFQASFLILARKAASIRNKEALASWLHGVAYRTAMTAKRGARRRRQYEQRGAPQTHASPAGDLGWSEVQAILDEEVVALPSVFRGAFILCHLEGKSRAEAARALGIKEGTVSSRLSRAQKLLQERLTRRGVVLSTLWSLTALSRNAAVAQVPNALVNATIKSAMAFAAGTPGAISVKAVVLAERALQSMLLAKVKVAASTLLVAVLVTAVSFSVVPPHAGAGPEKQNTTTDAEAAVPKQDGVGNQEMLAAQPIVFDSEARELQAVARNIWAIAFAPDGRTLVSVGGMWEEPGELQIFDLVGRKLRRRVEEPVGIRGLAFSHDGTMLVTADCGAKAATIRDPASGAARRVLPNEARLNHVALSPDGKWLATAGLDQTVRIFELASAKIVRKLHFGATVFCVAFSPDSGTLAACGNDPAVRLWDVASGLEKRPLEGHSKAVEYLAFSPDGAVLAAASWDKTIKLWNAGDGSELATLEGHTLPVLALAFSPDGALLASGSGKWYSPNAAGSAGVITQRDIARGDETSKRQSGAPGEVKLWDVKTRTQVAALEGHGDRVWSVAFSPDGKTLASASWDKTIKLWNVATRREDATLRLSQSPAVEPQPVVALAGSPDGRLLAVATEDNRVRVHEAADGAVRFIFELPGEAATCLAFSPDGLTLAGAGPDPLIRLWDMNTGKERRTLKGHTSWIYALAFSPDGRLLASGSYDKTIRLWDPASGTEEGRLTGHRGAIRALAFSPDGKTLAGGGIEPVIRLWDVVSRKERGRLRGHEGIVRALAFAPAGGVLASAGEDGAIVLWNPDTEKALHTLQGKAEVWALAFSADGKTLVSGTASGVLLVWDAGTGEQRSRLPGHLQGITGLTFTLQGRELISTSFDRAVKRWRAVPAPFLAVRSRRAYKDWAWSVAFSPDGKTLAAGSGMNPGELKLWDVASGQLRAALPHDAGVRSLAYSPDGKVLATGTFDNLIQLRDPVSGVVQQSLKGHTLGVNALAFSPEGTLLFSAGLDKTAKIWDWRAGRVLQTLDGHEHCVLSLAVAPDGRTLVTASQDHTIKLWNLPDGSLQQTLRGHKGGVEEVVFSPDGKTIASAGWDQAVCLWDAVSGTRRLRIEMRPLSFACTSVSFSPGGKTLALAACHPAQRLPAEIKLWDIPAGRFAGSLGHADGIRCVRFAPDGKTLASSDQEGIVRMWSLSPETRWPASGNQQSSSVPAGNNK